MSARSEVVRLLVRLAVALGLALGLAAVAALARRWASPVARALLLFRRCSHARSGGGGKLARWWLRLDAESAMAGTSTWRTVLGQSANPPTNTLAPAVPFVFAAVVLILVGVALA